MTSRRLTEIYLDRVAALNPRLASFATVTPDLALAEIDAADAPRRAGVSVGPLPDLTVVIRMSAVNAPFLSRLAENGAGLIMPVASGPQQGTTPIGAGPFRFVSYTPGVVVELARFDDYFGGPACLEKITIHEVSENTTRLTGLQTGELHMINDIPADRVAGIEGDAALQALKWFPLNWHFVDLNQAKFESFWDQRVPLAFDLAIDRQARLEGALWGQGQPTASPSCPTSAAYNTALQPRAQDLGEAPRLLEEAGDPAGALKVVFKATTNYHFHIEAVQIPAEWLREVAWR